MGARRAEINFFDQVTDLAVTPAAVSTFPITNLQSNVSDKTWRSPNRDVQRFTGSFSGGGRRISVWGIFPGRGAASLLGARVRVKLYADAARATVPVYDSGELDVFTWTGDGWGIFPFGSQPWGVEHGNHAARLTPLLRYFAAVHVGSFEITISDSGALDSTYFEARRFFLGDYVEASYNAALGIAPKWESNSEQERSLGGVLRRQPRARWREGRADIVLEGEAARASWFAFTYLADPGREILISFFQSGDGARLEADFTFLGSLRVLNPLIWANTDWHTLQLEFSES
jgi:hypothetical protein